MRKIDSIWVHCSASHWGNVEEITRWHQQRGWRTIGYHWLILNPFPNYNAWKESLANRDTDGLIQQGRPEEVAGSHVMGANANSLGICLVGDEAFSQNQIDSLTKLCVKKCLQYKIPVERVRGHREWWTEQGLPAQKSCPNLPMPDIRAVLQKHLIFAEASQGPIGPTVPSG